MRDLRAKGQRGGRGVRSEVMIDIGVVRVHDVRLGAAAGGGSNRAIIREDGGGAPCEIPAPESPYSWWARSSPRAAVGGVLDPVLRHGSGAQWGKKGRWEQPLGEMVGKRNLC